MVADGLNKVGLAPSCRAVDKERVIGESWAVNESFCSSVRELIEWPDDKCIERIAGV